MGDKMNIQIRKVETEELRTALFLQYKMHISMMLQERDPETKPMSDEMAMQWLDDKNEVCVRNYAFENEKVIGFMEIYLRKPDDPEYGLNKGLGYMSGYVVPEYRNRGIGTSLAKKAFLDIKDAGVHTIGSYSCSEEGNRFLQKLGVPSSIFSIMRLEFDGLDWSIIDEWLKIAKKPGNNWKVELHTEITDQFVDDVSDLSFATAVEFNKMNNQETIDLREAEKKKWQDSKEFLEKFRQYRCFLVKDANGMVIGYTEGGIDNENPGRFMQYVTAVDAEHRGNGIGKLLKALMLDHIRQNNPQVKMITTGNNDLNAPMLGINSRLGFKKRRTEINYKIRVEEVLKKLGV
jgi:ribosomal protein S18 acetylase RimI-like enzyme